MTYNPNNQPTNQPTNLKILEAVVIDTHCPILFREKELEHKLEIFREAIYMIWKIINIFRLVILGSFFFSHLIPFILSTTPYSYACFNRY